MAYRDDSEALKERYESLASELEGVRAQASALACEEAALAKELDAIRERLDGERHGARRRKTHAFAATMFSAGACALLSLTAIARVMTSEIAPLEMHDATPIYNPVEVTTVEAPDPSDSPQAGFVWVEAQEGTRIYEGERFIGTAPLMFPVSPGTHAIRAIQRRTGVERTAAAVVHERWVSTLVVDFEAGFVSPAVDDTTNPL